MTLGDVFVPAFVTLFVVIEPLGLVPLFAVVTKGMDDGWRRKMAIRGVGLATFVLLMFAIGGEDLLTFFGITIPAFRIAGGMLLFLTALEMLFEFRTKRRTQTAESSAPHSFHEDVSVFPLAIPLLAGPGAITSIILLTSGTRDYFSHFLTVIAALLAVMLISLTLLIVAARFIGRINQTVITVATRLFGLILAALAAQFVIDGIKALVMAA